MLSRRNSARNSIALCKMISTSDKVVRWISSIPSFIRVFIEKLHHYHTTLFIGFASDTDDYTQIDLLLDTGASSERESRAGILATPRLIHTQLLRKTNESEKRSLEGYHKLGNHARSRRKGLKIKVCNTSKMNEPVVLLVRLLNVLVPTQK